MLQLSQMKPTNSVDFDGIPSIFLKKLTPVIAKLLSILFRRSYLEGKIPDLWRHKTFVPI